MSELKRCTHIFSNGTEFECFIYKCEKCSRYRNGKCRILNSCCKARFDSSKFPYSDLLESKYAIICKHYTEEKISRRRTKKQIDGQIEMFKE